MAFDALPDLEKYWFAIVTKSAAAGLSDLAFIPISTEVQCRDRTLRKITPGIARLATQAGAKDTPNPAAINRSTVGCPVEQRVSKITFQVPDLLAQWRLRHTQPLRCSSKMQGL